MMYSRIWVAIVGRGQRVGGQGVVGRYWVFMLFNMVIVMQRFVVDWRLR